MRILNYKPEKPGSFGIARFDLEVDPLFFQERVTLSRFRLCRSKKGTLYFTEPPFCVDDDGNGEKKWVKYFSFGKDDKRRLEDQVIPLLDGLVPIQPNSPSDEGRLPIDF